MIIHSKTSFINLKHLNWMNLVSLIHSPIFILSKNKDTYFFWIFIFVWKSKKK